MANGPRKWLRRRLFFETSFRVWFVCCSRFLIPWWMTLWSKRMAWMICIISPPSSSISWLFDWILIWVMIFWERKFSANVRRSVGHACRVTFRLTRCELYEWKGTSFSFRDWCVKPSTFAGSDANRKSRRQSTLYEISETNKLENSKQYSRVTLQYYWCWSSGWKVTLKKHSCQMHTAAFIPGEGFSGS